MPLLVAPNADWIKLTMLLECYEWSLNFLGPRRPGFREGETWLSSDKEDNRLFQSWEKMPKGNQLFQSSICAVIIVSHLHNVLETRMCILIFVTWNVHILIISGGDFRRIYFSRSYHKQMSHFSPTFVDHSSNDSNPHKVTRWVSIVRGNPFSFFFFWKGACGAEAIWLTRGALQTLNNGKKRISCKWSTLETKYQE